MSMPSAIPVIMYHGVGREYPGWEWNHLVIPLDVFAGQMRTLKEKGWRTISLDELHAHMATGANVPEKAIVLTFDDGYRDNFVYALPILKKYGHRAVIWMSVDFVDPRTDLPPTLEDVWANRVEPGSLDSRGYLSWREMRQMVQSGSVEIQSHAKTHTWYPCGPAIIDFHRPQRVDGYEAPMWLAWNMFPREKYRSMHERLADRIPYGTPVYEHGKSLAVRRYFEDPALTCRLVDFVREKGGAEFFARLGWRQNLEAVVRGYGARADRVETNEEFRSRVRSELIESRREIETVLGTKVHFLCWPGGAHTESTLAMAEDAGYLATTALLGDPVKKNVFGEDPRVINRIGSGSPWMWRGRFIKRTSPGFFMTTLDIFTGRPLSIWKYRSYKLIYALRYYLTRKK
jgi:peptidoglycan/xylan/chitin deacetylase (PgdA/CDA1 family)